MTALLTSCSATAGAEEAMSGKFDFNRDWTFIKSTRANSGRTEQAK